MTTNVLGRRRLLTIFSGMAAWLVNRSAPRAAAGPHDQADCEPTTPTTTFTYDELGRLLTVTRTVG